MPDSLVAAVPLLSGVVYIALLLFVQRRASGSAGIRPFLAFLITMAVWSMTSVVWRLTLGSPLSDALLRLVVFAGFAQPATFLWFLQTRYPSRWSARVRRYTLVLLALFAAAGVFGAINRVMIEGDTTAPVLLRVLAYITMLCFSTSYLAGFGYLAVSYRGHRDPFERNRLKYIGISTMLIMLGAHTNLVPVLRALPVDQALNAAAASLLAFSIVRYRLFNIDVALRRSAIHMIAGVVVSAVLLALAFAVRPWMHFTLFSPAGVVVVMFVGLGGAGLAALVRRGTQWVFNRLFVGGEVGHRQAMLASTKQMMEVLDLDELGRSIGDLCQRALESSYVAILLTDERGERLVLSHVSGPFPRPQAEWTIRTDNALLRTIARAGDVVTPFTLGPLLDSSDVSQIDRSEFAPYRNCVCSLIVSHGSVLGVIFVASKVYDAAFTLEDLDLLRVVAGQAGLAIENARLVDQLQQQAHTDFITGLPNHRRMQDIFRDLLAAAGDEPFTVAMADVDNFKALNDVYGHPVGDEALRRLAGLMRASIAPEHVVGRYGGDEFLFLLPGLGKDEAAELMTQVAARIRKSALATPDDALSAAAEVPIRITWGVGAYPGDGSTWRTLVSAADSALLEQRLKERRSGKIHTARPTAREMLEQDPEKLRVAQGLLQLIDAKDPYTSEHSQQIASFALLMAEELRLSERDRYALWLGSLLHDVGKIGTPAHILRKPGLLTPEEIAQMREHAALGESVLRGLIDLEEAIQVAGCHHERWDGSGYPRGLKGVEIPRFARAVSVADAFSAMVHDRPYRKGMEWGTAASELRRHAGTQFDPEMVEAFVRAIGLAQRSGDTAAA